MEGGVRALLHACSWLQFSWTHVLKQLLAAALALDAKPLVTHVADLVYLGLIPTSQPSWSVTRRSFVRAFRFVSVPFVHSPRRRNSPINQPTNKPTNQPPATHARTHTHAHAHAHARTAIEPLCFIHDEIVSNAHSQAVAQCQAHPPTGTSPTLMMICISFALVIHSSL